MHGLTRTVSLKWDLSQVGLAECRKCHRCKRTFAIRRDALQVHTPHAELKCPPVSSKTLHKQILCFHKHYTPNPNPAPHPTSSAYVLKGIHKGKPAILWRLPLNKANCGLDSVDHKKETPKNNSSSIKKNSAVPKFGTLSLYRVGWGTGSFESVCPCGNAV